MKIPVTRDKNNNTELVLLDVTEVLYIQIEDRNTVYYTLNGKFYHLMPSLSVLEIHLNSHGFRKLDRINLVNTNKIKAYDDSAGKVFFEEEVTKTSIFTTVSFINKNKLRREIEDWISKNI